MNSSKRCSNLIKSTDVLEMGAMPGMGTDGLLDSTDGRRADGRRTTELH